MANRIVGSGPMTLTIGGQSFDMSGTLEVELRPSYDTVDALQFAMGAREADRRALVRHYARMGLDGEPYHRPFHVLPSSREHQATAAAWRAGRARYSRRAPRTPSSA